MKKLILLVLFGCITATAVYSQSQGNSWRFGEGVSIDFISGVPTQTPGSQTGIGLGDAVEGVGCQADPYGNLLFYSNGEKVWNKEDQIMPNGDGLFGGRSSTQAALVVPAPINNDLFFLFTTGEFQEITDTHMSGCYYSIVNMCLDSSRGDVDTIKNVLLVDTVTEKLTAVEDAAGSGYWIVTHKLFSDAFYAFHITSSGISAPVISHIGEFHGGNTFSLGLAPQGQGQMKFSAQGNKLALVIANKQPGTLEIFDFDNETGVLSNLLHINPIENSSNYGVEFSPNGSRLYVTAAGGYQADQGLYQFDLTAGGGNVDSIRESMEQIWNTSNSIAYGLQTGPDGKIYVVIESYSTLGRINSPDALGSACDFDPAAISLLYGTNHYSFPGVIAGYKYHNGMPECRPVQTGISDLENVQVDVFPNPAHEYMNISVTGNSIYEITLIDELGRVLRSTTGIGTKKITLNLSDVTPGMYFLQVREKYKLNTKKIIVE